MCDKPNVFSELLNKAEAAQPKPLELVIPSLASYLSTQGSRRRRLWELPTQALCPVIGVCLPMPLLRRRINKLVGGNAVANAYELHCGAINDCGQRTPVAEALQRELDQRYIRIIRLAAQHKTSIALTRWWDAALQGQDQGHAMDGNSSGNGNDIAGIFWAVLTHARCDTALQEQVLRDIHMLQHQVGAANRADLRRLDVLADENAVLARELAQTQARSTRLLAERAATNERQAAELIKQRADLLGRDTLLAALREDFAQLEAAVPGLRNRQDQAEQIRLQLARIHELERALLTAQQTAERERRRAEEAMARMVPAEAAGEPEGEEQEADLAELSDRSVLCVGGRQGVVPIYRALIERTGGRFLHHDGGEEDASAKLDASLAAADLVICQTGCISHDAYWRVKDHCKRHGKRCVFVDKPSASSLQRALGNLGTPAEHKP